MASPPRATRNHYATTRTLTLTAVRAARAAWNQVSTAGDIGAAWAEHVPALMRTVSTLQVAAAASGAGHVAVALAEQGTYVAPRGFVNPSGWGGGVASDGRMLSSLLYTPVLAVRGWVADGVGLSDAMVMGRGALDRLVVTQISDTARSGVAVGIAARPTVAYTRMVGATCCDRCLLLAGRLYRWNDGFLRHPNCLCQHVPTTVADIAEAYANGLADDPYEYFTSLSEAEQDRRFGKNYAQAIRDGADIYQTVNSKRGRGGIRSSWNTTEGTTKRGVSASLRGRRLTPDGIYEMTKGDRKAALDLLVQHKYILPGGQQPGGVLRGNGLRPLAQGEVGMTAAQKRLLDAQLSWQAVCEGRNPYRSGAPLTPSVAARAENEYARWLATRGNIY